ncbi:mannitol dehydrogenase family protein [Kozakia baliensis]|nr:mannitol dehydrogenase family protein [Kozakia baliensis]
MSEHRNMRAPPVYPDATGRIMIDLNNNTLSQLPPQTKRFPYDRSKVRAGIVHLSVGNFHRAHQCWYMDQLLAQPGYENWGFCGIGLLDDATERLKTEAFPAQDDLYTLTRYDTDGSAQHQVIGSIVEYLFAPPEPETILGRLSDPAIRIVSMTITEGGYNQEPGTGAYRLDNPLTKAELADPSHPRSAFGYIVEALRRRRDAGGKAFTVLSCDNLRDNGVITRNAVLTHAHALDADLAVWIEANVTFPSSMVDRITPAVHKEDADRVNAECGVHDLLPVISEEFAQWVIEDHFSDGRPDLDKVGVQFVKDVHPYELAKVRMLNASHSMLAYPGQLAGLSEVKQAIDQPLIHRLVDDFMTHDVIPILKQPEGMDLNAYKNKIIARFSNPKVGDRLARITGDGGSKLPTFIAPTLQIVAERGGDLRRIAFCIACFIRYLRGVDDKGQRFEPFEPHLDAQQRALANDPKTALKMEMFKDFGLEEQPELPALISDYDAAMQKHGTLAVLEEVLRTASHVM